MAKRELSKCRVWERERRDRLKSCFTALGKLLPSYEPSSALSKTEILQRAASLIQELQARNSELLGAGPGVAEAAAAELRRLGERVERLLTRNEQLSALLRQAGIRAPSECGTVTHFRQNRKWSSKIAPEAADNIVKKLSRVSRVRPIQQTANISSPGKKPKLKKHITLKKKKSKTSNTPNENIDLNNKPQGGGKTKPGAAIVAASRRVYTSPSLGAGTLILADGSVLPVVGAPPPVPPPGAATTTVILMPRAIACRPGPGAKVPIPPLAKKLPPPVSKKPPPKLEAVKRKKRQKEQKSKITKPIIVSKVSRVKSEVKKVVDVKKNDKVEGIEKGETVELKKSECERPPEKQIEEKNQEIEKQELVVVPEKIVMEEKEKEIVKEVIVPPPAIEAFSFSGGGSQEGPIKADEAVSTVTVPTQDHSELSNDIFASLAVPGGGHSVPGGGHHPESMSPTAAFLLAFPLVSTLTGGGTTAGGGQRGGVADAAAEETSDSRQDTPTLLQIGAMDGGAAKTASQEVGGGLLALDTFTSFFSASAIQRVEAPTASFFAATKGTEESVPVKKSRVEPPPVPPPIPPPTTGKQQYSHSQQCNTFNPFSDVPPPNYGGPYSEFGGFQEAGAAITDCSKTKPVQQSFSTGYQLNQQHSAVNKRTGPPVSRPPVNWMTTPDTRHPQPTQELAFPPPPEFNHHGGGIFGGGQWSGGDGFREEEGNRWSWSPGRLLPPLIGGGHEQITAPVPSTLPTLVGDLALGPGVVVLPEEPPPGAAKRPSTTHKNTKKQTQSNYDMSGFSVSQLVDERKEGRRSNRASLGKQLNPVKRKLDPVCYRQGGGKWPPPEHKKYKNSNTLGVIPSNYTTEALKYKGSNALGVAHSTNYTAEALIGHADTRGQVFQQFPGAAQYQPPPTQSYIQQEYPFPVYSSSGGGYTSTYTASQGGGRQCAAPRRSGGRSRRHHAADVPVSPYVDLSFLSSLPPGAVGSPVAEAVEGGGSFAPPPPPPPLYYGRHYSGGGSGSPTTGNTSSLTNFNLSTIFPEMGASGNKAPLPPTTPYVSAPLPPQSSFPFATNAAAAALPFANS